MKIDLIRSEASTGDVRDGLFRQNGGRFPLQRVLHQAAADVEEGLEFWKTIAGNIPPQRRVSREFLNRNG